MASYYRPLQPAPAADAQHYQVAEPRVVRKRRQPLTMTACAECRKRKSKCDGIKPMCTSCAKKGQTSPCVYDSQSRIHAFKQRAADLQEELERMREADQQSHQNVSRQKFDRTDEQLRDELEQIKAILPVFAAVSTLPLAASKLVQEIQQNGMTDAAHVQASLLTLAQAPGPLELASPSPLNWKTAAKSPYQHLSQHYDFGPGPSNADPYTPSDFVASSASSSSLDDLLNPSVCPPDGSQQPYTGEPGHHHLGIIRQDSCKYQQQSEGYTSYQHGSQHRISHLDVFGNLPMSSSIRANGYPSSIQQNQVANFELPMHMVSPLWLEPETIVGGPVRWANSTLRGIRRKARSLIQQGVPVDDILGSLYPTTLDLSPDVSVQDLDAATTVSDWSARFIGFFSHLCLSDRVACWMMTNLQMRWQAFPSAETYCAIPEWYRPLPVQSFVPHMACPDILIWPQLREMLVKFPIDFVLNVTQSISVSWPYSEAQMFCRNAITHALEISPAFIAWCFELENWSLDRSALVAMPQFAGKVRFR